MNYRCWDLYEPEEVFETSADRFEEAAKEAIIALFGQYDDEDGVIVVEDSHGERRHYDFYIEWDPTIYLHEVTRSALKETLADAPLQPPKSEESP